MNSEETSKLRDLMDSPSSKNSREGKQLRGRKQRLSTFNSGKVQGDETNSEKMVQIESKLANPKNRVKSESKLGYLIRNLEFLIGQIL